MDSIEQNRVNYKSSIKVEKLISTLINELSEMKEQIKILNDTLSKKENKDNDSNYTREEYLENQSKMINYIILCGYNSSNDNIIGMNQLTDKVKKFIELGWVTLGGVSCDSSSYNSSTFSQAMILYSNN